MTQSNRLRLFVSIWLVLLFHWNPLHDGPARYVYLTRAVAERGTVHLDAVSPPPFRDMFEKDGHLFCNNNPGIALLAVPLWAVVHRIHARLPENSRWRRPVIQDALAHFVAFASTTALAAAATAVLVGAWVERRRGDATLGLAASCLYSFGTIAFHFGTHLQQNVVIAFLGFLAWIVVVAPDVITRRASPALAGFLVGLGALVDLSILPIAAVIVLRLLRAPRPARSIVQFAFAALPPLVGLLIYQQVAFGNPFLPPQSYYAVEGRAGVTSRFELDARRFFDLTVLPTHGFVFFMPFVLVPFIAGLRGRLVEWRELIGPIGAYLVYVAGLDAAKFTQFGPRYLLPAVPFSVVLAALSWRREDEWYAVPLSLASLYVNTAGAQLGVGSPNVVTTCVLWAIRGPWLPVLDWVGSEEFRSAYGNLPRVVTPFGLFLLLGVCLLVIWLPVLLGRARQRTSA
jgi:hypothetical protein